MEVIYFLLIVFLGIPAAALVGCAALEASLMKSRPQLSWLLPAAALLASALIQRGLDGGSGLDTLLWSLPAFYGRCAFLGTAAGAAAGAVMRWSGTKKELSPA